MSEEPEKEAMEECASHPLYLRRPDGSVIQVVEAERVRQLERDVQLLASLVLWREEHPTQLLDAEMRGRVAAMATRTAGI